MSLSQQESPELPSRRSTPIQRTLLQKLRRLQTKLYHCIEAHPPQKIRDVLSVREAWRIQCELEECMRSSLEQSSRFTRMLATNLLYGDILLRKRHLPLHCFLHSKDPSIRHKQFQVRAYLLQSIAGMPEAN